MGMDQWALLLNITLQTVWLLGNYMLSSNSLLLCCLLLRYKLLCEAHFNASADYPSQSVIEYSTIGPSVDATGKLQ